MSSSTRSSSVENSTTRAATVGSAQGAGQCTRARPPGREVAERDIGDPARTGSGSIGGSHGTTLAPEPVGKGKADHA